MEKIMTEISKSKAELAVIISKITEIEILLETEYDTWSEKNKKKFGDCELPIRNERVLRIIEKGLRRDMEHSTEMLFLRVALKQQLQGIVCKTSASIWQRETLFEMPSQSRDREPPREKEISPTSSLLGNLC